MLETTFAARTFEVDQKTQGDAPMVYAPQAQSGNFFNRQERNVRSLQLVEALTVSKDDWLGQHVFKVGVDLQHSRFDGATTARRSTSCASTARWPSARPTPRADEPRGQRHSSSPCSRRIAGASTIGSNFELGLPRRPRRRRRAGELLAARRRGGQRAAGGPRRSCAAASASSPSGRR